MPEHNTVRGIADRPDLAGPPHDPSTSDWPVQDIYNRGIEIKGDPGATSRTYFIETKSTALGDIEVRQREAPEEDV